MSDTQLRRPGSPSRRTVPHSPSTGAKRGAPLGNTNALKHGFYARAFQPAEQSDLAEFDVNSLEHEIELMRVFIRRTAEQAAKVDNLPDSLMLLNVMSRASLSLASLMRTQRAALEAQAHAQFQRLIADAKNEFRKANALTARLEDQLAGLEAAYDAAVAATAQAFAPASAADSPSQDPAVSPSAPPSPLPDPSTPPPPAPLPAPVPPETAALAAPPEIEPPAGRAAPAGDHVNNPTALKNVMQAAAAWLAQNAAPGETEIDPDDQEEDQNEDEKENEDELEEELEDCKIPFDCLTCPERRLCESCPAALRPPPHLS